MKYKNKIAKLILQGWCQGSYHKDKYGNTCTLEIAATNCVSGCTWQQRYKEKDDPVAYENQCYFLTALDNESHELGFNNHANLNDHPEMTQELMYAIVSNLEY